MPNNKINSTFNFELPSIPNTGTTTFFVVLHGAIGLVESKDDIRAHLVDMEGDHLYLAGSWFAERPIPKGLVATLTCPGIDDGSRDKLDGSQNPVFKLDKAPDDAGPAFYATFILPRPSKIHYFNRFPVAISGDAASLGKLAGKPETVTEVHVLEYALKDSADFASIQAVGKTSAGTGWRFPDPGVTGLDVTDWGRRFNGGAAAALHIFNFPQTTPTDTHNQEEFENGAKAFGVTGLSIAVDPNPVADNSLPDGLSPWEITGLAQRELLLKRFANFLRVASFDTSQAVGGTCKGCCAAASATLLPRH